MLGVEPEGRRDAHRGARNERRASETSANHQAWRSRASHWRGIVARDSTSESDAEEEERVEWGAHMYGVRMSPANPQYVGRGDNICGGEVVYTIEEIRALLRSQPR